MRFSEGPLDGTLRGAPSTTISQRRGGSGPAKERHAVDGELHELQGERFKPVRHGHRTGGASPTYSSWRNMQKRCFDKQHLSYDRYGGRGISVYFGWLGPGGFTQFLKDVGLRPSRGHELSRIDSEKNYGPGNVRWDPRWKNRSDAAQKRCCRGAVIKAKGPDGIERSLSLYAWAELLGVKYRTLSRRIQRGMKERAFAVRGRG
jgi:hypothetical protein